MTLAVERSVPDQAGWRRAPAWSVLAPVKRQGYAQELVLSVYREHGVIPKASRDDNHNRTPDNLDSYQLVEPGDVVFNKMKAWSGSVGVSGHRGIVSPDYMVCQVLSSGIDRRFLHYLLRSQALFSEYRRRSKGIRPSQWRLYFDELRSVELPLPGLDTQRRIADMLDTETARIDTLIEKNERVLELLDLRDKSTIDRLVNSGEVVDEHGWGSPPVWPRVPIRSLTRTLFVDGDWIESPHITDSGVRLIQTGNIGIGRYREQGFRYVSDETFDELRCTEVLPGDVLICRLADPVGRACVAPDLGVRMITSVDVTIVRPKPGVLAEYVALILSTERWLQRLSAMSQGGTRDRVARLKLGELRVPLPNLDTQGTIVDRWATVRDSSDRLRSRVDHQQELLRTRRQALITAAVTGEIEI